MALEDDVHKCTKFAEAGRAGTNSQIRHPEHSRRILLSEVSVINTSQVRNGGISMTGLRGT